MLTHSAYKSRRGIHLTGETAQNQHNTSRRTTVYPINGFRFLKLLYSLRCNDREPVVLEMQQRIRRCL